ncbi:hypothetical protein [Halomonas sp.]|uniref:hypothetical protein n=1 Tax=Halomonas sp. TaxID=1486246 RepID=UPI00356A4757
MNRKIKVESPLVILHGDEMAQVAFKRILDTFVTSRLDMELLAAHPELDGASLHPLATKSPNGAIRKGIGGNITREDIQFRNLQFNRPEWVGRDIEADTPPPSFMIMRPSSQLIKMITDPPRNALYPAQNLDGDIFSDISAALGGSWPPPARSSRARAAPCSSRRPTALLMIFT